MAKLLGVLIGFMTVLMIKHGSFSCKIQCSDVRSKMDHQMVNKLGYQAFTVEGCFCLNDINQGKPRRSRSVTEKNESEIIPPSNVSKIEQKQQNTETAGQIVSNAKNNTSKNEYCNPKEQRKYSPHNAPEPGNVEYSSINVSFPKRNGAYFAEVTWSPPKENVSALVDYLVLWHTLGSSETHVRCRIVHKDETFTVLSEKDGWKYPKVLTLLVVSRPRHNLFEKSYPLLNFPSKKPAIINLPLKHDPSVKKKKNSKSLPYWAIGSGIVVGLVVLAFLVYIYRDKKRPQVNLPVIVQSTTNNTETKPLNNETYFASYLPESEEYCHEVATVACKLGAMGYKVVFDQVDSVNLNEMGFNIWVDKQVLEAKKILVFCSPGYVRLWQSLATSTAENKLNHVNKQDLVRVRYEIKWISDVYSENCSTSRIVCIKTDPKMNTKNLPPWMKHNMLLWPQQKEDVIRRFNDQSLMIMNF